MAKYVSHPISTVDQYLYISVRNEVLQCRIIQLGFEI